MGAQSNAAPVIIKRKKVIGGGGHHGGAWKVAYADFVTAMMAFFMLMWLLNATTEKQRKGLADYFSPTIPISPVSGGGDGAFGGDNMMSELSKTAVGTGASSRSPAQARRSMGATGVAEDEPEAHRALARIQDALTGRGGEILVTENELRHIVTRLTDEGLIVELFATDAEPLFEPGTDQPTALMQSLARTVAAAAELVENHVAIGGHVRAHAVVLADNPVWKLSSARASKSRTLLEAAGLGAARIRRVTGHADRKPAADIPMAARNDRIEVIFLRALQE